jgi:hypothetical protein
MKTLITAVAVAITFIAAPAITQSALAEPPNDVMVGGKNRTRMRTFGSNCGATQEARVSDTPRFAIPCRAAVEAAGPKAGQFFRSQRSTARWWWRPPMTQYALSFDLKRAPVIAAAVVMSGTVLMNAPLDHVTKLQIEILNRPLAMG